MSRDASPLLSRLLRGFVRTLGALCVVALAAVLIGRLETHRAARGHIYERADEAPPRSVAIVLGARVYQDGSLSHAVADRVACGLALYRAGRVERVLISGDHGQHGYDEVSAMGAALIAQGVPAHHVFLDHAGFRTLDTMHRAQRVFGVRDAAICTQRFHLARSLYLAEAFGIDAIGVVADRRRYRGEAYNEVRESLARAAAVFDRAIGRSARLLGPPVSLASDARLTHDRPL